MPALLVRKTLFSTHEVAPRDAFCLRGVTRGHAVIRSTIQQVMEFIRREEARMSRCRPIVWLAAMLIVGLSPTPGAIGQQATVEGRAEAGGVPVQFALVQLVRVDSTPSPSDSPPQGITNADGRYRFDGVAPGRYRVQLLR